MEVLGAIAGFVILCIACWFGEALFDALLVEPVTRWNARRLAKASTFHCGIRVLSGHLPGFSRAWRHGLTTVSPGVIHFTGEAIVVMNFARHSRQPLMGECSWSSFDNRVFVVRTEAAEIEFAARTPQVQTIRQALMPGE